MTHKEINEAIAAAKRFIAIAERAANRTRYDTLTELTGCKETGACRRASMDLTRALADLRGRNR